MQRFSSHRHSTRGNDHTVHHRHSAAIKVVYLTEGPESSGTYIHI